MVWLFVLGAVAPAQAQLGALLSPGRLARPHEGLEGITQCQACHERGQRVTPQKCLVCHAPVAQRIQRRAGVHADAGGDCIACHVEHTGLDGELRPFDTRRLDHARVTGFPLDGRHANLPGDCAACHKERSFLTLSADCASCHTDVHKGSLGSACATCHTTSTAFKELSPAFSHSRTAFPLQGAHQAAPCASCHPGPVFAPRETLSCTSCHRDPHRPALGAECAACHTEVSWRTERVDHDRTAFPLRGEHAGVACAVCHMQPAARVKPPIATCGGCHEDVHRGTFAGQDCAACHDERGFKGAPFDHSATAFALTGAHAPLACAACHTPAVTPLVASRATAGPVDFVGLETSCSSCHRDPHEGELGAACESCHSTVSFAVNEYVHAKSSSFFAGLHAPVSCASCHVPQAPVAAVRTGGVLPLARFAGSSRACVSCHRDVHLGQLADACETCHTIEAPEFRLDAFAHSVTAFTLTGRHEAVECAAFHKVETGRFPAGQGTAVRFASMGQECRACHEDVHLGQLDAACEACHNTTTFSLGDYHHRRGGLNGFFAGRHLQAACEACHKPVSGQFPAGIGTAVMFANDTRCTACHEDRHRGALGPRCADCHRP